ncbi:50S ribosomal protein L4 [bacterium]|nr:50S ribosomal protein L4 [bacterium]
MQAVTQDTSSIFAGEVNQSLLSQALNIYLGNLRQATARTKTRSEINRSKKKWFKQKGTGNARHGARTPNIFVGGGVSHGPTGSQSYKRRLSQEMKHRALQSALLAQLSNIYLDDQVARVGVKTKEAVAALGERLHGDDRVLVVVDKETPELIRSYNNLATVYLTTAERVNVLQVANADSIVMTSAAVAQLEKRLMNKEK